MNSRRAILRSDGSVRRSAQHVPRSVLVSLAILPLLLAAIGYRWYQLASSTEEAKLARCKQNLARIFKALQAYQNDYSGKYPRSLTHFVLPPGEIYIQKYGQREWPGLYPEYISDASVFKCPDDQGKGFDAKQMIHRSYLYRAQIAVIGPKAFRERKEKVLDAIIRQKGKRMILVQCPFHIKLAKPFWATLVLRADGTVEWFTEPPPLFRRGR